MNDEIKEDLTPPIYIPFYITYALLLVGAIWWEYTAAHQLTDDDYATRAVLNSGQTDKQKAKKAQGLTQNISDTVAVTWRRCFLSASLLLFLLNFIFPEDSVNFRNNPKQVFFFLIVAFTVCSLFEGLRHYHQEMTPLNTVTDTLQYLST